MTRQLVEVAERRPRTRDRGRAVKDVVDRHGGFGDQRALNATEVPDRTGQKTQWHNLGTLSRAHCSEQPAARIVPIGLPTFFRRRAQTH